MADESNGRDFTIEGNDTSGYVGVDPEYRNYANETDRPYLTDEEREQLVATGQIPGAADEESDEEPKESDEENQKSTEDGDSKSNDPGLTPLL